MLVNLSNHPSQYWDDRQRESAHCYGNVVDLPFPAIAPKANNKELHTLAQAFVERIMSMGSPQELTVHVMGEMTFTFMVVTRLKELGIRCVASPTERKVTYTSDGVKQTEFSFVKFREY